MEKLDVAFYEVFAEEEEQLKKFLPKSISVSFSSEIITEENKVRAPAKLISIRTHSKIPKLWLNNISGIVSRTTGIDHLLEYSIPCAHLPNYCSRSVAEQSVLLWMALLRKLPKQIENFSNFERSNISGFETKGKTIVVCGVGKIGHEICKIAKGLEMNVIGVDTIEKHKEINYLPLEQAISQADIILCSMNLTKENYDFFNYSMLKKSKKGAIFINIARGEISPAADLLKLLNEDHLSGVALDVFEEEAELVNVLKNKSVSSKEEIKSILELSKKENVILTPHNAFNTKESTERKALQTVQQIERFLKENKFIWEVKNE